MDKNQKMVNLYNEDEVRKLVESNERLVYFDNGTDDFYARYADMPDIIVDLNEKLGHNQNFKIYDNFYSDTPIVTTIGYFLDKCDTNVWKDIIDRIAGLQQDEIKINDYKLIDVDMLNEVKISMEQEEMER